MEEQSIGRTALADGKAGHVALPSVKGLLCSFMGRICSGLLM